MRTRSFALLLSLSVFLAPGCGDSSDDSTSPGGSGGSSGADGGSGGSTGGSSGSSGSGGSSAGGSAGSSGSSGSGGTSDAGTDALPPSNIIAPERRIDWSAGVPGGIDSPSVACPSSAPSVVDFGATGDGTTDDASAFQDAINAASEGSAVRIPEGSYMLREGLTIDKGVVLCGEGSDKSRLLFDADATGISIVKYDRGDFVAVTDGHTKGSTELTVADSSSFVVGQYAELQQTNDWAVMDPEGVWESASWVPEDAVGQMFKVIGINGNTLSVDPPVYIDYNANQDPKVRRMGLVEGAGLQGLYFARSSTHDRGTVLMKNTAMSWIRDCVSEDTTKDHVGFSSALWCEVRDSLFREAFDHGGGGHGYGTNLGNHATANLVENNIFVHLRHSMLVQVGATGNVFGYNYSREPYQSEGGNWTPCDISLHGHYNNMNLFEGNTVQEVDVSDYWGPSGPGNTFFRNRVESEGIEVMDYSHGQNVVGNELSTDINITVVDSTVTSTFIHGNYENGALQWDSSVTDHDLPTSLYLSQKPSFFESTPWPATGGDLAPDGAKIPAQTRYEQLP